MPSLSSVLEKNKVLLENNYCNLGVSTWSGLLPKKHLLSYDLQQGWSVKHLNPLECCLRKVGFYPSTHLENIVYGWNRYNAGRIDHNLNKDRKISALEKRLHEIWKKSRGSAEFPAFTFTCGNTTLKKAQIIVFGDEHEQAKPFHKYLAKTIEQLYRPGDIILVEGTPAGKRVKVSELQSVRYITSSIPIKGLEPKNIEALNTPIFRTTEEMSAKMVAKIKSYDKELEKIKSFSSSSINKIELRTKTFFKKELLPFYEFFMPDSRKRNAALRRAELLLQKELEKLRKGENKNLTTIRALFLELGSQLESQQENVFFKNLSKDQIQISLKNGALRHVSFCKQMEKYARPGRRVFVIAGLLHFLKIPFNIHNENVVAVMKRRGFILTTPLSCYRTYKSCFGKDYVPAREMGLRSS